MDGTDSAPAPSLDRPPRERGKAAVASPCVSLCKMDRDSGLCQGCLRTIDEIIQWSQADDDFKRAVWQAIALRAPAIRFD